MKTNILDLSAYISFLVRADVSDIAAPVFVLTDNSVYPTGVVPTGIFTVTQPDLLTRTGKFVAPDISAAGGSKSIGLRLDCKSELQQGEYRFTYEVAAAGYDNTILTRSVTVNYSKPVVVLNNAFDLFTPSLEYEDATNYAVAGFTQSVVRSWAANIVNVGTLTGPNSASFDLKYGGAYYDAAYIINFLAIVTYQSSVYGFFSIIDSFPETVNADAYTPPSLVQILTYLTTLKTRLDALINSCQKYDKAKADYEYAYTLYSHAIKRICANDKVGVNTYIQEIVNIYNNNVNIPGAHTDAAISAFVYDCGGGSVVIPAPFELEVVAGTAGAIAAGIIVGSTTYQNNLLDNRSIGANLNGAPLYGIDPLNGGVFYTKPYLSDTVTFSSAIQDGDVIKIYTIG